MPFKSAGVQDISVSGATHCIFVFVQFRSDPEPQLKLFKDAAATIEYETHIFEIQAETTCAVYFWLTADSDPQAEFEEDPCGWECFPQPDSVTYEYMMEGYRGFSLKVNNWNYHALDGPPYAFDLKVRVVESTFSARDFMIDPTIIEKGDATPTVGF